MQTAVQTVIFSDSFLKKGVFISFKKQISNINSCDSMKRRGAYSLPKQITAKKKTCFLHDTEIHLNIICCKNSGGRPIFKYTKDGANKMRQNYKP